MNRNISINDPDGDAVELSLTKEGVCVTATTRDTSPAGGDQLTVGPFELSNLRAALDGFAPVQESRHADALTFDQARSLIEERDQAVTDRDQAVEALDNTLGRAIKAERELNDLRTQLEADGARIIPTSPTISEWGDIPEDVQEAMVERGAIAAFLSTGPDAASGWAGDWDEATGPQKGRWRHRSRAALAAALTSPPTRPEWADLEDVLKAGWPDGVNGAQNSHIARALHEAGVRVPEVGQ